MKQPMDRPLTAPPVGTAPATLRCPRQKIVNEPAERRHAPPPGRLQSRAVGSTWPRQPCCC